MTTPLRNLLLSASFLLASSLSAQTTVLSEDFSTGVPPTGWTQDNINGAASQGWVPSWAGDGRAQHEDESGGHTAHNRLVSGYFDLTGLTAAYLHFDSEITYSSYLANNSAGMGDGYSRMKLSFDGGLTWSTVWDDTSVSDGRTHEIVDITSYIGSTNVLLGVEYYGTFAQEWFVDDISINDDPNVPPPTGTAWIVNLPTSFAATPMLVDFEALGGVVPPWMAMTMEDATTGAPDPEAWCNIGQLGPMAYAPFSGNFCLEMGLSPASTNYHYVRNAMVLGLNGANLSNFDLTCEIIDHGEEVDVFDGIWISEDGLNWFPILDDWTSFMGSWSTLPAQDLSAFGVDISGDFYLMFAQTDNFPYADLDGVGIDDISVGGGAPSGPQYSISNLVAGGTATLECSNNGPNDQVVFAYSFAGAGPTNTPYGVVEMSMPISHINPIPTNLNGVVSLPVAVPGHIGGRMVHTQCVVLLPGGSALSNAIHRTVQ